MNSIERYYEDYDEDSRLIKDNAHRIEFISTTYLLDSIIRPNSEILDLGAGTGRYSFYYADKGNKITSVDIVPKNINIIKGKIEKFEYKNVTTVLGDGRDLSDFDRDSFDVVLCFGPMYHLQKVEERVKCIKECMSVLKKGGILAIAYISRYAEYAIHVHRDKNYINDKLLSSILYRGVEEGNCFYFSTYDEIENLMLGFNVTKIDHVGTDGIVHMIRENINLLNEEEFNKWMRYHLDTFRNPSLIGYSLHCLYLCRKI